MRIVDVAAEPVGAPGRRQELHRPLRAGRARRTQLAERGLDEVHRGQHLPGDAEAALRLAVVAEQPVRGLRGTRAERRERQLRRRRQADERSPRGEHLAGIRPQRGGQPATTASPSSGARGRASDTGAADGAPRAAARAAAAASRPRASRRRPRGATSSSSRAAGDRAAPGRERRVRRRGRRRQSEHRSGDEREHRRIVARSDVSAVPNAPCVQDGPGGLHSVR